MVGTKNLRFVARKRDAFLFPLYQSFREALRVNYYILGYMPEYRGNSQHINDPTLRRQTHLLFAKIEVATIILYGIGCRINETSTLTKSDILYAINTEMLKLYQPKTN